MSGTRRRSLAFSSGELDGGGDDYEQRLRGFELLARTSPLVNLLGPFHARGEGGNLVLGLRLAEKHTNSRGLAHGGVLLTLADVALGYTAEGSVDPPARLITVSVSADFAESARLGDWVEARVDVQRVGGWLSPTPICMSVRGT